jgi:thiamine phosphate synthase YjbQ (UPF0047 family)
MSYLNEVLTVQTHRRNEMIDITAEVAAAVEKTDIDAGMAIVYCPHTTAGITIKMPMSNPLSLGPAKHY